MLSRRRDEMICWLRVVYLGRYVHISRCLVTAELSFLSCLVTISSFTMHVRGFV